MLKKHRKNPESTISYSRPRNRDITSNRAASNKPVLNLGSVSPPRVASRLPKFGSQNARNQNNSLVNNQLSKSFTNNEGNYPSVLQIQLLPSDEDDSKYGSSDPDSSSPIVNYTVDESPTMRTDRRTLSQMGKLAIVELSFSDPENDIKVKETSCSSCLPSHSSLSLKRASSGMKIPTNDILNQGNGQVPYPPSMPSNTYVARQKMLMQKNKKCVNGQSLSSTKAVKAVKRNERKWKPEGKYVGLDSFFTAGVEKENIDVNDEQAPPNVHENNNYPTVTVGLADSWRPESSLSHVEEPCVNNGSGAGLRSKSNRKDEKPKLKNNKFLPKNKQKGFSASESSISSSPRIVTSEKNLASPNNTDTPRISMTDFDFLSALPPTSKGDDLSKLHRASTVTLFALSPQPPDVWNDDSEVEIPSAVQLTPRDATEPENTDAGACGISGAPRAGSHLSEADRNEIDRDDALALDALTKEINEDNLEMMATNNQNGKTYIWEDDSLSIEDNDDGSGLTSSADGEESDEGDFHDFKPKFVN